MPSDVIVLSTGNAILAGDISRVEAYRGEMDCGFIRIFLRGGNVIMIGYPRFIAAEHARDKIIAEWSRAREYRPPAPTPSVPRSSVYDPHANGNNGIRGADMPRSPKEVLAAREAAERSKVDELQNAIEAKITDVISGFSGAPWSYFIDTTRYSHSVVMRVRRAFAEAGWACDVGDPSDDPRDTGYHLVFKEGDPSNRR